MKSYTENIEKCDKIMDEILAKIKELPEDILPDFVEEIVGKFYPALVEESE